MVKFLNSLSKFRELAVVGLSAAALFMVNLPAQANVNLVTNGSFQQTTLTGSNFLNNTDLTGWTTTSNYTFIVFPGTATSLPGVGNGVFFYPGLAPGPFFPATSPDGGNFLAADGAYLTGTTSQLLTGLTPGQSYIVSFYQAGAQQQGFSGATTDQWIVSFGNQVKSSTLISNPSHGFSDWTKESLTFTANNTSEVLGFFAAGTPDGLPPFSLLDGVSVAATPEPAYFAVMGAGLLGVFAARRRQKSRS